MQRVDSLPSYERSQKQIEQLEREALYRRYIASVKEAELRYASLTGRVLSSTGVPNNVISSLLGRSYCRDRSGSDATNSDVEDESNTTVLVPGYRHTDAPQLST